MSTAERLFDRTTIKEPGNPPIPAFKFTCSKCGATETMSLGSKGSGIAAPLVQQRMRTKGWEIGTRANGDFCPNCLTKSHKKHQKTEKQENNVVTFIKAEEPPAMSREDRRLIFAKIDEVYLDENTGYSDGWTDQRVADDLGVPVAWVRDIRAENFGEERNNAAITKQLDESKSILDKAKKLHMDSKDELKSMMSQIDKASNILKHITDNISKIQKDMNAMNHEITRQETNINGVWKSLGK